VIPKSTGAKKRMQVGTVVGVPVTEQDGIDHLSRDFLLHAAQDGMTGINE
jgi:hypothetical protein